MTTKDKLILIGQILEHAKTKRKVVTEPILRIINKYEKRALAERMPQYMVDRYIKHGKEVYKHKEDYCETTPSVKYLI